jgi:N-acetylglucosamine-6-phosphate deacetylase
MTMTILNARLLDSREGGDTFDIHMEDGRIARISPGTAMRVPGGHGSPSGGDAAEASLAAAEASHDAAGAFAAPGYIDIHSHGGKGFDVMDATAEAFAAIARFHASEGTTSFLATTMTAPLDSLAKVLDLVRSHGSAAAGEARILGVHLEGPFLSLKNAGAQDVRHLRNPDEEAASFVLGNADIVRRITLAPELAGSLELTRRAKAAGIGISAGHDASIDEEILEAIDAGLDCVTHIYCCSSGISRRQGPRKHLGLTEMGMADPRLTVEVIADRRGTPDSLFSLIWKAKGRDAICLVSDSTRLTGMPDGEYLMGDELVEKRGDEVSVPRLGVYAGSVTSLGQAVRNIVTHNGIPLRDAVYMATEVPVRLLGLSDRGRIEVGRAADLNLLGPGGELLATFIGGEKA